MNALYYIVAFAAGIWITLQTSLNSQLARGLGRQGNKEGNSLLQPLKTCAL